MKFIWYIASILLILLVLISNPKSESLGVLKGQTQLFSNTRQAITVLESLVWSCIILFLSLTTVLAIRYEQ
uniref:Probable protein-export membrane protein SecG n=1 Tax=Liagoropsis maxima TaxID=1653392 RepID=A0A1G4NVT1_9FLOR|nr:hypothetical protein P8466_pgp090 [Liagoropsis maxima]SCW22801.1 secG [Liagoropsis maxima]